MGAHRAGGAAGFALFAAVWLVLLLSAVGLGLVVTSSLEAPVARNFEAGWAAANAAETALLIVAHELASVADWNPVLQGSWRPSLLREAGARRTFPMGGQMVSVEALTHFADCQQLEPCTNADRAEATLERPWGRNNPAWVLLGSLEMGSGHPVESGLPFEVVVWAGDDPAETDGDPRSDGSSSSVEPASPGAGLGQIVLRAEAFGLRGSHAIAAVTATRGRPGLVVRLHNWSAP